MSSFLIFTFAVTIRIMWGSIIVWQFGGFGHILDAEYGFHKKISAVCGFSVAAWLLKNGI